MKLIIASVVLLALTVLANCSVIVGVAGNNNRLVKLNYRNNEFASRPLKYNGTNFDDSVFDPSSRVLFLFAGRSFVPLNIDTNTEGSMRNLTSEPLAIAIDNNLRRLFAIHQDSDNIVSEMNPLTGRLTPLVFIPSEYSVVIDASCYDESEHIYFITVRDMKGLYSILSVNVVTRTIERKIAISNSRLVLKEMHYDQQKDRFVGIANSTIYALENIHSETPKLKPIVSLRQYGRSVVFHAAKDRNLYHIVVQSRSSVLVTLDLSTDTLISEKRVPTGFKLPQVITS